MNKYLAVAAEFCFTETLDFMAIELMTRNNRPIIFTHQCIFAFAPIQSYQPINQIDTSNFQFKLTNISTQKAIESFAFPHKVMLKLKI